MVHFFLSYIEPNKKSRLITFSGDSFLQEDGVEGRRAAVIVGIDEYKDKRLQKLEGAENDAVEIARMLQTRGNFRIDERYLLLGEKANYKNIRVAINDILRKESSNLDTAIFYISGYAFVDAYENAFMLPYDFSIDEPFLYGIDLNDIFRLSSFARGMNLAIIMDFCVSSISSDTSYRPTESFVRSVEELIKRSGAVLLSASGEHEGKRNRGNTR